MPPTTVDGANVNDTEVQAFSNTFCPSVLVSTLTPPATAAASTSSSSLPTASAGIAAAPTTAQDISTTSPAANPAATAFGANTPGTAWGNIQDSDSTTNRGPAFDAVSIIMLCVAAMVMTFRFFARIYTKSMRNTIKSVSWDDWLAIAALIGTAGLTADIILGTKYGMGKHLSSTTNVPELVNLIKVILSPLTNHSLKLM